MRIMTHPPFKLMKRKGGNSFLAFAFSSFQG